MVEMCYKTHTTTVNPIIDWTDGEVWEFIKEYNIPYCTLYDEGFKRLGCIGCPMGSKEQRIREFERWPKYKNLYMIAFQKMIENRGGAATRSDIPQTAEQVMNGYLTEHYKQPSGGVAYQPWLTSEDVMKAYINADFRRADFTHMPPQE